MIEMMLLLAFIGALFYAYNIGWKSAASHTKVEELSEHADRIAKSVKTRDRFDSDDDYRDRVQDRFSE